MTLTIIRELDLLKKKAITGMNNPVVRERAQEVPPPRQQEQVRRPLPQAPPAIQQEENEKLFDADGNDITPVNWLGKTIRDPRICKAYHHIFPERLSVEMMKHLADRVQYSEWKEKNQQDALNYVVTEVRGKGKHSLLRTWADHDQMSNEDIAKILRMARVMHANSLEIKK
jgi:hypothetical protein